MDAADVEIMLREQAKIVSGPAESVMDAAFAAKRAALTVDFLVQNLSPHSNRGSEGAVTTKLYTNMEGIHGSNKIFCGQDGYSKEEAVEEAKRKAEEERKKAEEAAKNNRKAIRLIGIICFIKANVRRLSWRFV